MRFWNRSLGALAALAVVAGIWARLYQLATPAKQIFDEVYFPVFAADYLSRVSFFDVHPPLGKFLIAAGIWFFGDTSFGWRIVPALFGIGLIALAGKVWHLYRESWLETVLIVMLVAMEPILIVYSRTGLMDGIQLFLMLACFGAALWARRPRQIIVVAVLIGLAVAIKWVALAIIVPVAYVLWRKKLLPELLISLPISVVVYGLIVYLGQVIIKTNDPLAQVVVWHSQALEYHLKLTATHPWGSKWFTWPFLLRPVLFLYDTDPDGKIRVMTAMGNPVLWWASTVAVVASLAEVVSLAALRKKIADHPLVPLLLGYAACFLPWMLVHRVVFLYHYIPAYAFALMMTVYWLAKAWRWKPWFGFALVAALLAVSVYFLPFAMGLPLTAAEMNHRIWVHSWLYNW